MPDTSETVKTYTLAIMAAVVVELKLQTSEPVAFDLKNEALLRPVVSIGAYSLFMFSAAQSDGIYHKNYPTLRFAPYLSDVRNQTFLRNKSKIVEGDMLSGYNIKAIASYILKCKKAHDASAKQSAESYAKQKAQREAKTNNQAMLDAFLTDMTSHGLKLPPGVTVESTENGFRFVLDTQDLTLVAGILEPLWDREMAKKS